MSLLEALFGNAASSAASSDDPDEVTVTAPPKDFSNSAQNTALDTVQEDSAKSSKDHVNEGVWGLLPEGMRHGALRDALGALRDAYIVNSGGTPSYENSGYQTSMVGRAMAGFDKDPGAAAERVAHLGYSGTSELASKLRNQGETTKLRKAQQQETQDYHDDTLKTKRDNIIQAYMDTIGPIMRGAKNKDSYAKKYARADRILKRVDPEARPEDIGVLNPEDWSPEIDDSDTLGATTGQVLRADTSKASINQRATAAEQTHQDRIRGQNISAAKKPAGSNPTSATILNNLINKQNKSQPLTAAEQKFWDKNTATKSSGSTGRTLPAAKTSSGGFQNGKVYTDAKGNKAKYSNGNWVPVK